MVEEGKLSLTLDFGLWFFIQAVLGLGPNPRAGVCGSRVERFCRLVLSSDCREGVESPERSSAEPLARDRFQNCDICTNPDQGPITDIIKLRNGKSSTDLSRLEK